MGTSVEIRDKSLLLFDGVCNLCNGAVNFIIDKDHCNRFVFASLQSKLGQQMARKYNFPKDDFKSMVLVKGNKVFLKSDAALEVSRDLSKGWRLLFAFKIIPKFIRNGIYDIIAANRYKWFGKEDQCRVPSADLQNRFVSG